MKMKIYWKYISMLQIRKKKRDCQKYFVEIQDFFSSPILKGFCQHEI